MKIKCLPLALLLLATPLFAASDHPADAPTSTGESGMFTIFSGRTLAQGAWSFGLYYNNWDHRVAPLPGISHMQPLTSDWAYDWNRLDASFGYGITDNFEVSVMVPYEDYRSTQNNAVGIINGHRFDRKIAAHGLGDVRVGAKWNLFTNADDTSAFALNAYVETPTGDQKKGIVTGSTGFGVGADWSIQKWALNLGYHHPGNAKVYDVPDEVRLGIGYDGRVSDRFDWITELQTIVYSGNGPKPKTVYDVSTGGRLWFGASDAWAFNFALRTELGQLSKTDQYCPIGGLIGLTYVPRFARAAAPEAPSSTTEMAPPAAMAKPEAAPAAPSQEVEGGAAEKPSAPPASPPAAATPPATAPPTAPPPPAPAPKPEQRETVQFGPGSARVSNIAKAKLDEVALKMKQDATLNATVIGFTDSQGSAASNAKLSLRRAQAVKDYLVKRHGIDPSRIKVEGRGASEPVASNDTAAGREHNRRAVVILMSSGD